MAFYVSWALVGVRSGKYLVHQGRRFVAGHISLAEFAHEVENSGHFMVEEQPNFVAHAFLEFFRSLQRTGSRRHTMSGYLVAMA